MNVRQIFAYCIFVLCFASGCGGGGGGGSSNACDPFRILNGESCDGTTSAIVRINTFESLCTGTIIAPNVVMTAAHCFPRNFRGFEVITSNGDSFFTLDAYAPNAWFDSRSAGSDIAVAYIDPAFVSRNGITPIPVSSDLILEEFIGDDVIVSGFGKIESNAQNSSPFPRSTFMTVSSADAGTFTAADTSSDKTGNACAGDSGAPALVRFDSGQYYAVGVVSRGSFSSDCNKDPFTIFTFVGSEPASGLLGFVGIRVF